MDDKVFNKKVNQLGVGESFEFIYDGTYFNFNRFDNGSDKKKSFAVRKPKSFDSMNVGKITNQYITLYAYDMMFVRSQYKMHFGKIQLR